MLFVRIECGLSASTAELYARHGSCFIAYAELAEGGGYIDHLRSTRKATTVRSALFGLRRAFAYVRLAGRERPDCLTCSFAHEQKAG